MFFLLDDGTLTSVPTVWTDVAEPDVFVTVAASRSPFQVEDLLALAERIDGLDGKNGFIVYRTLVGVVGGLRHLMALSENVRREMGKKARDVARQ